MVFRKKLLAACFIGSVILHGGVSAQDAMNKDSLLRLLPAAKDDSTKVKLYYTLANEFFKDNLKEAERFCAQGLELSKKINFRQGILNYYTNYANILNVKGNFDSVLMIDLEAVAYAGKNTDSVELARTMLNAGMAYSQLEDYEDAVVYIEGAKDILYRNKADQYDGSILNLLQLLYHSMRQYRKATDYGIASVAILEKKGKTDLMQQAYNNLGLNYISILQYDSAKYFLAKATTLANETGETMIQIATNLNLALISLKQEQVDSVKIYVSKALDLSRKYHAYQYEGLAQYGMAYYYLLKKDYANCRLVADSALLLARQYNMRDLKQKLFPVLSSLYYSMQDSRQGYYYFTQYELLSDSVLNESVTNSTIRIEKKFETEKKEAKIALQQQQIRQKTALNYFLGAGAVALLAILVLGYRNYRNRQKLQQTKIDELETERQLTATEAVLKGEEQERTRLAKDLHDGLGGMLSGIKFSLNSMKGNLIMTAENSQVFERSIDMLDSSIHEMRRVAHNMMPEVLVKYGLNIALKAYCNEIDSSGVIHASYQFVGGEKNEPDQTTAIAVYRIVQELVNNAIKHAAARNVLVQLHIVEMEKQLTVTVEDDGKGFDPAMLGNVAGMGWRNIQNRVEFLKGKVDIASAPGNGTSVLIEIGI